LRLTHDFSASDLPSGIVNAIFWFHAIIRITCLVQNAIKWAVGKACCKLYRRNGHALPRLLQRRKCPKDVKAHFVLELGRGTIELAEIFAKLDNKSVWMPGTKVKASSLQHQALQADHGFGLPLEDLAGKKLVRDDCVLSNNTNIPGHLVFPGCYV
jgi:hypothetical protein